jgi:hypothetical protein
MSFGVGRRTVSLRCALEHRSSLSWPWPQAGNAWNRLESRSVKRHQLVTPHERDISTHRSGQCSPVAVDATAVPPNIAGGEHGMTPRIDGSSWELSADDHRVCTSATLGGRDSARPRERICTTDHQRRRPIERWHMRRGVVAPRTSRPRRPFVDPEDVAPHRPERAAPALCGTGGSVKTHHQVSVRPFPSPSAPPV